jgi:DNA-binding FadR family transcriptional regulator
MDMSAEFHARVAQATHNPAVVMFVESFRGPLLMSLERARETAPEMGRLGTEEHKRFVNAVRKQDCDAATGIMREHLHRTARRVKRR